MRAGFSATFGLLGVFALMLAVLPTNADAALITRELDLGMANSDVTSLQTFLAADASLYPEGIISGYYGSLTAAAVVRFQAANGLAQVGRVGPQTRALLNARMGSGSPVTQTGDLSAPIIYPETVSTGPNSLTFAWTNSEASRGRIMYGTTWPFLYATAPSVSTTGYGSTANITIGNLNPNSMYYYVREAVDGSGNVQWTTAKPLSTR
ncbi:MAG: peptidoglycan-binding protein [Candidatus Pacebacteria bacterium]|nr:peptidoglycan-binding protein [Candidatus Paceibacterota bacterium]